MLKPLKKEIRYVENTDLDSWLFYMPIVVKYWPSAAFGKVSEVGVHRLNPNKSDLYDAFDVINRDNYTTLHIYIGKGE